MQQSTKFSRQYLDDRDLNISITYSMQSNLSPLENDRYCVDVWGKITDLDEYGNEIAPLGDIHAYKLLIGTGSNNGWNAESIFDAEDYTFEIGKIIYDYKKSDFSPLIRKYYQDDLFEPDILILTSIEIFPAYRGLDIAPYAIKDLLNNFGQNVSLAVADIFPYQFAEEINHNEKFKKMEYDKFTSDFDTSFHKLLTYFEKMGFEQIPKISRKLVFMNLGNSNDKFDGIELD